MLPYLGEKPLFCGVAESAPPSWSEPGRAPVANVMDASAETHASDGRRSSDCVVVVGRCFRACRRYSCRTEHTSAPSVVANLTIC